jgi:hypothetical protein
MVWRVEKPVMYMYPCDQARQIPVALWSPTSLSAQDFFLAEISPFNDHASFRSDSSDAAA